MLYSDWHRYTQQASKRPVPCRFELICKDWDTRTHEPTYERQIYNLGITAKFVENKYIYIYMLVILYIQEICVFTTNVTEYMYSVFHSGYIMYNYSLNILGNIHTP